MKFQRRYSIFQGLYHQVQHNLLLGKPRVVGRLNTSRSEHLLGEVCLGKMYVCVRRFPVAATGLFSLDLSCKVKLTLFELGFDDIIFFETCGADFDVDFSGLIPLEVYVESVPW